MHLFTKGNLKNRKIKLLKNIFLALKAAVFFNNKI